MHAFDVFHFTECQRGWLAGWGPIVQSFSPPELLQAYNNLAFLPLLGQQILNHVFDIEFANGILDFLVIGGFSRFLVGYEDEMQAEIG